tara:strand:+ start:41 stop:436 length:396 start_codon:yes stop_codon:yes gene_type:complete
MKKTTLLLLVILSTCRLTLAQNDWLLGHEIGLKVKLSYIQYGDMSTYIGFETIDGKEGVNEISFAYWTWNAGEGSIKKEIEEFDGDEGSVYKITLRYTAIKELEYRGFEEGNVETGETSNEWVLTKIVDNN